MLVMVVGGVVLKNKYRTNGTGCVEILLNLLLCINLNKESTETDVLSVKLYYLG